MTKEERAAFFKDIFPLIHSLLVAHIERIGEVWVALDGLPQPKDPLQHIIWLGLRPDVVEDSVTKRPTLSALIAKLKA